MLIHTKHAGYKAGQRQYPKGGGGGAYYGNLDKLYDVQMQQAQQQMGIANQYTYPAMGAMYDMAKGYGSNANREKAATSAAADFAGAQASSDQALTDQFASMGVDPGSKAAISAMTKAHTAGAAADAAGRNGARTNVDNQAFARMQDFTSMGLGVSSNATSALANAGSTASTAANGKMQNAMNNTAGVAGAVQGGINLYGMTQLADGGYVQKFARGGVVQPINPPAPPAGAPANATSTANSVAGAAAMPTAKYGGKAVAQMATPSPMGLNPQVANSAGQAANTAGNGINAQAIATQQVDHALGNAGVDYGLSSNVAPAAEGIKAGAGAADAMGAGAAAEGATAAAGAGEGITAAAGAAEGLGAGASALGAAMPWLGAAMLAGSAFGLFADGGDVQAQGDITPGADGQHGGEVAGPGGPKDDKVPALLSDGEFVMPIGAVKFFGLDRLEKMRQQGLQYERQLGIPQPGAQQQPMRMH